MELENNKPKKFRLRYRWNGLAAKTIFVYDEAASGYVNYWDDEVYDPEVVERNSDLFQRVIEPSK